MEPRWEWEVGTLEEGGRQRGMANPSIATSFWDNKGSKSSKVGSTIVGYGNARQHGM